MNYACSMCGKKAVSDKPVPPTWFYVSLYRSDRKHGLVSEVKYVVCPTCAPTLKGFLNHY